MRNSHAFFGTLCCLSCVLPALRAQIVRSGYTRDSRRSLALHDILPEDATYDQHRPPGSPTIVSFHVTVLTIDSIDEESMTYATDIFLAQSWQDRRLRFHKKIDSEYRILDVNWLDSLWRPDVFFKNAKQVTFHEITVPNHYLWMFHDGTLLYMSK
ncbi:unnamed protein product [Notodromas monacha]|uniref:Neurotransmitter-gated ion-channel ligand-binding domain-containing protein n=1 Tax=Notodromas monacha TaxID=399045 RepID=A0A7R9C1J0_9CRUS|nr:unnamed protein product [Notodromas monacha]CAG0924106.1 unnamed protein product [Notodromas monacha]